MLGRRVRSVIVLDNVSIVSLAMDIKTADLVPTWDAVILLKREPFLSRFFAWQLEQEEQRPRGRKTRDRYKYGLHDGLRRDTRRKDKIFVCVNLQIAQVFSMDLN